MTTSRTAEMHRSQRPGRAADALATATCVIACAALIVQYVLLIKLTQDTIGAWLGTLRFISYFTILSNVLVALATGFAAFGDGARLAAFFGRARVRGGIALYIGVTGTVYVAILRHLWQPQGWQWWADSGLHYATPVLYVLWWLFRVPHGALRWRDLSRWLLFPLGYLLWTFLRGAWVGEYPYPFIDVLQHGWPVVLRNALGVLLLFLALGALLIALDRALARFRAHAASA